MGEGEGERASFSAILKFVKQFRFKGIDCIVVTMDTAKIPLAVKILVIMVFVHCDLRKRPNAKGFLAANANRIEPGW